MKEMYHHKSIKKHNCFCHRLVAVVKCMTEE